MLRKTSSESSSLPTSSCFSRIRLIASCSGSARRSAITGTTISHISLAHAREAGRVGLGELSARLPRVRRNARRSSISWLNRACCACGRPISPSATVAGSGVAIAVEISTTSGPSAASTISRTIARMISSRRRIARGVEERPDDVADEAVPRRVLLADLARRRLPSLEDVERHAREAAGGRAGRRRRRRGASGRRSGSRSSQ